MFKYLNLFIIFVTVKWSKSSLFSVFAGLMFYVHASVMKLIGNSPNTVISPIISQWKKSWEKNVSLSGTYKKDCYLKVMSGLIISWYNAVWCQLFLFTGPHNFPLLLSRYIYPIFSKVLSFLKSSHSYYHCSARSSLFYFYGTELFSDTYQFLLS